MASKLHRRREILLAGGSAAAVAALAGPRALAQAPTIAQPQIRQLPSLQPVPLRQIPPRLTVPPLAVSRLPTALGSGGAWGEVQVRELPTGLVPVYIRTANRAGVADLTRRRTSISLGNGAIVLTTKGITINGALQPWNTATINALVDRVSKDVALRNSLFELRAALVTAYPHAVATSRQKSDVRVARAVNGVAQRMGTAASPGKRRCTTTTVVDTVTRTREVWIEQWVSAEERFDACVTDQLRKGIPGGEAAAVLYCGALGLVDLFVGVVKVIETFIEEVERTVVTCSLEINRRLVDLYRGIEVSFPGKGIGLPVAPGVVGAAPALTAGDVAAAVERLQQLLGDVSPFTTCLLQGQWSFAALGLPVATGGSTLEVPYGVKVCISAACARRLRLENVGSDLQTAATSLLAILAALNADFAAVAATLGVAKAAEAAAIAATLGATATTALTAVAALLLFLVYYAALVAVQIQLLPEEAFADGVVCIEHPTFVIAAVTLMIPGIGSVSQFTPPIVTG